MPACHKCRWNGKKSNECLNCHGPSLLPNNGGQNWKYLDNIPEDQELSPEMINVSMQIWRDTESVDEHRPVDATGLDSKLEDELRTTLARIMSGNKNSVCSKLNAIARSNKNEFGDACHALSAKFSLLTKRELEMVCGICAGRMQTHIARDAGYDPRLSSVIRKSIVKKLNCSDLFRPYRRKNG